MAAADTFRAGAIDQLVVWGERAGVEVVRGNAGGDPAAVVFDAVERAKAEQADVLLVDTAGRLQNKVNLMKELEKIKRVILAYASNSFQMIQRLDKWGGKVRERRDGRIRGKKGASSRKLRAAHARRA